MKKNKPARKHRSVAVSDLLQEITPSEKIQARTKMILAARLDDLITASGWSKTEFAQKLDKNPSEITKWLSGTHNFTIDTLAEISVVFGISLPELFAPKQIQVVNKIQLVVDAQHMKPALTYQTPLEGATLVEEHFHTGTYRRPPSTKGTPS